MILKLDSNEYILSHFGMSGSWRISKDKIKEKHTHLLLEGTDKSNSKIFIGYVDPRRFGFMHFTDKAGVDDYIKKHLGATSCQGAFGNAMNNVFYPGTSLRLLGM